MDRVSRRGRRSDNGGAHMGYCNQCGAALSDQNTRFCHKCGAQIALPPGAAGAVAAGPVLPPVQGAGGPRTGVLVLAITLGLLAIAGTAVGIYFGVRGSGDDKQTAVSVTRTTHAEDDTVTTVATETTVEELQRARWQTVGTSVRGTDIQMLTVGTGSWRVLVIGGMYGDGYSAAAGRGFADYVESNPSVVPLGTELRVIPSLNPDGVATWSRGNANAVDINRNFPSANWRSGLDSRDTSSKTCTGGAYAGSEPETQVVMSCLEDGFDLVIVIYNPGYRIDYDGDATGRVIAYQMAGTSGMKVGEPSNNSFITGSIGLFVPQTYGKWVVSLGNDGNTLTTSAMNALVAALTPPTGL